MKYKFQILVLFSFVVHAVSSQSLAYAGEGYTDSQLVQALDLRIRHLGSDAAVARQIEGWSFVGLGAAGGVGSLLAAVSGDSIWRSAAPVFGIAGGVLAAAGGLILLLPPSKVETFPTEFQSMHQETPEQLRNKVIAGEAHLADIAKSAEQGRKGGAVSLIVFGAGYLAWYIGQENDKSKYHYYNYDNSHLLYSGAISLGLGVINLLFKSPLETVYEDYQDWKKIGSSRSSLLSKLSWGVSPVVGRDAGGLVSATLNF